MSKAEKVIVVDIGNTSTTVGVAVGSRVVRTGRLASSDGSDPKRIETLLRRLASSGSVTDAVLCSVVPRLNPCWRHVLNRYTGREPLVVSHKIRLGVQVDYPHPETIGADRLANAVAAWARYHGPVIVADFGTALTFDVITGDGRYVGGVIAPGLPLMTDYLCERTALLPPISLGRVNRAIGKSTREAMRIGAMVGYRGMVREIFHEVVKDMKEHKAVFCATGGYAGQAVKGLDVDVDVLPNLTLEGLIGIRELNRG
jgi:type III pantothenate kinase